MRTKLLLLFFALGEITASAQTDSLPNITKTSNGKLIDPIQIHEVVVTGTRNETDIRHLPMTISVIDRKQIEQSMQPSILPILTQQVPGLFITARGIMGYGVSGGAGGGRQQAADRVARLGLDRIFPGSVGHPLGAGIALAEDRNEPMLQVGVGVEKRVHELPVEGAAGGGLDLGGREVAVTALPLPVVIDVAGTLLEVGGDTPLLDELGQQVGDLLAGQVSPAELGDRVVAEVEDHLVVEPAGALRVQPARGAGACGVRRVDPEFVQEEPPQALVGAAVTREQGALDHIGQVDEPEDGFVRVGEIVAQDRTFALGERFPDKREVAHGRIDNLKTKLIKIWNRPAYRRPYLRGCTLFRATMAGNSYL